MEIHDWFASSDPQCGYSLVDLIRLCRGEEIELRPEDWTAVVRMAQGHGLLGLLQPHLERLAPPGAAEVLSQAVRAVAHRNLLLVAETLRVAAAFARAGIEAGVFKGCLLSQIAHGASHLRQVADLDFLVRPEQRAAAVEVLGQCGYFLEESWTPAIRDGHFEYDCESCLINSARRTCVDLHWNFTPRNYALPVRIEAFFDGLRSVPFHGQDVLTFSPQDQILALCIHGAKHYWHRLEWLYTISALIRNNPDLDLASVLRRGEQMGLRHIVASGLILSRYLFACPLPQDIVRTIDADSAAWEMARQAMRWVGDAHNGLPTPMQIRAFHSRSRATMKDKVSYWLGVVATPTEKDYSRPLPRILHPLYLVLRLVRLLIETMPLPKGAMTRESKATG